MITGSVEPTLPYQYQIKKYLPKTYHFARGTGYVIKSVLLLLQSGPASDEIGCEYPDPETTPGTAGNPGDGSEGDSTIGFANLNRLSWILIIVCSGIGLLLFILVFCRAQKMRRAGGRKVNFIFRKKMSHFLFAPNIADFWSSFGSHGK